MKRLVLFFIVLFSYRLAQAQWTVSGSDIYYTTGNVSIGTTTPVERLTIVGNALADKFRLNNLSTPGPGAGIFAPAASTLAVYTSALERMRISSSGFVGIGTTNPLFPLQINGSGDILAVSGNGLARNGIYIQSTNTSSQSTMYADNDRGSFASYCGILTGCSANSATLFGLARGDRGFLIADGASSLGIGIGTLTSQPMILGTNNSERLRVLANGNILVGKTSQTNAAYIMDVNGKVRANAVVVNSTGADYVFSGNYNLLPLSKLEKFIKNNHHLPGIAPAVEMHAQGMDLGDNQTRLLAKIEELTLYIVEQQKQILVLEEQTGKIEDLQKQINELRNKQAR
jgi:hypothetical protein